MVTQKNQLVQQLIAQTAELAANGMTPATSSNFSARLNATHCVITVSGRDKGKLTPDDFMEIGMDGIAVDTTQISSAETLLHTQIYQLLPNANVVLHTHSLAQTLLSMHYLAHSKIEFTGYELQKAFVGIDSHESRIDLPIVANSQNMQALAESVQGYFQHANFWGYLIAGHGIYTWGKDMQEARRHLDAFEFLLNAELTKLSFRP